MIAIQKEISVGKDRKEIIRSWPKPKTLTDLRGFIGLFQFFPRFIKQFSKIAAPLTNLTRKGLGITKWNQKWDESFKF